VKTLADAAGGIEPLLNLRHAIAKEKGWKDEPPSLAELAKLVAEEPNVIRRPILLTGKKAIVGWDERAYAQVT
jgi:arsenate reductase-like glutaredoxin family protein